MIRMTWWSALALEFSREAVSVEKAIHTALADVKNVTPSARLIEVSPDLVGLTDIADLVGVSRQAMRKLMLTHPETFPLPVHEGSASIWHLAEDHAWAVWNRASSFLMVKHAINASAMPTP
ncbi:hypothetical protein GCM10011403_10680 [Pseudohongiella nitratireducens]|jgi:predicted DNA-binding transcriptional regulator AlpA|uniref:DNA-binding protein n=1 Tax=Pseudohongiella nitratireducens TaxID=1768907 RepID=A0A917GRR8_9GAMM|nr:hypothetical protein GCM10011403_10680 [Pseudohongiella nitratireducens]